MNPSFRNKVYQITKLIPTGKVATYGQLATLCGNSKAARAVGICMKNNPNAPIVPCHRVVAFDGKLTGYSAGEGIPTKKRMLLKEGVLFINNSVNLSLSKWYPD